MFSDCMTFSIGGFSQLLLDLRSYAHIWEQLWAVTERLWIQETEMSFLPWATWSRTTAPSYWEEPVDLVQEPCWTPQWTGVSGMSDWEKTPGRLGTLDRFCLLVGQGMPKTCVCGIFLPCMGQYVKIIGVKLKCPLKGWGVMLCHVHVYIQMY